MLGSNSIFVKVVTEGHKGKRIVENDLIAVAIEGKRIGDEEIGQTRPTS